MKSSTIAAIVAGAIALGCVAFVIALFLIKALWVWTIPDLFPGAVEQGWIVGSISWLTLAKIAILVAILSGAWRGAQVQIAKKE